MTHPHTLKVMSFNIRNGAADDGENRWDNRKAFAVARIRACAPDLLGLQECRDDAQAAYIKSNLPEYHFHGTRREGGDQTALEMAPVLIGAGVFQIEERGHFWLSETPAVVGSKSWDAAFARTVSWARLLHQPTGRVVTFANTHFDYRPASVSASASVLHRWLNEAQREGAVIVTGDFNADKDSSAYQLLTAGSQLRDAYREARGVSADESTFHDYGRSTHPAPIDWILVSRHLGVVDAQIDRTHNGALYPSDHYPVTAVLRWM